MDVRPSVSVCRSAHIDIGKLPFPAGISSKRHWQLLRRKIHDYRARMCQFHFRSGFFASQLQFLELRFNRTMRCLSTIVWILHVMFYMPIILYLPSLAFAEGAFAHWFFPNSFHLQLMIFFLSHRIQHSHSEYNRLLLLCNLHHVGECLMFIGAFVWGLSLGKFYLLFLCPTGRNKSGGLDGCHSRGGHDACNAFGHFVWIAGSWRHNFSLGSCRGR